jgi:hypothetical protein
MPLSDERDAEMRERADVMWRGWFTKCREGKNTRLRAEVERLREELHLAQSERRLADAASRDADARVGDYAAEVERLRAQVAAVEALLPEWKEDADNDEVYLVSGRIHYTEAQELPGIIRAKRECIEYLRAALASADEKGNDHAAE